MSRKTVGQQAWDIVKNSDYLDHSAVEQMQEQLIDYEKKFIECMNAAKNIYDGDFYIVVETKKEPKLNNVIRNYFIHRKTCPTPTYDNVVYRYHRSSGDIQFLWVLPSKDVYTMMMDRPLEIPLEQRDLLQFVLDDSDGTLLRICKKLNGEID